MDPASRNKPVILLTGPPGVGKSTAMRKIVALLGDRASGFYTLEVGLGGKRRGFKIVTTDGHAADLATKDPNVIFNQEAPFRRYRVNLEAIDTVAVPSLYRALEQGRVVVIDEIGPMEFFSEHFCQAVLALLESEAMVVGTIVQRPNAFADRVKAHHRVEVRQLTVTNRDGIVAQIVTELVSHLPKA